MATLVIMAVPEESQGLFEKAGYNVLYTGMGMVKASFHLSQFIHKYTPQRVINLGTAGSHQYAPGLVTECTAFVQRAPFNFLPLPSQKIFTTALTELTQVTCGSADFVETQKPITACDIFDMEAYALAYCCQELRVPFHSIKCISDKSDQNTLKDWKKNLAFSAEQLLKEIKKINIS